MHDEYEDDEINHAIFEGLEDPETGDYDSRTGESSPRFRYVVDGRPVQNEFFIANGTPLGPTFTLVRDRLKARANLLKGLGIRPSQCELALRELDAALARKARQQPEAFASNLVLLHGDAVTPTPEPEQ
jgi:hypothetical protein